LRSLRSLRWLDPAGGKQPAAAMRLATLASVCATPGCDSLLRVLRASRVADPVGIVPRERLVGPRAIRKKRWDRATAWPHPIFFRLALGPTSLPPGTRSRGPSWHRPSRKARGAFRQGLAGSLRSQE
ncbi:hypothetical protein PRIPAC_79110, partial [Pristionchus pacificus]|uniref:Uncharacterized protein n=1 Tax=Pristionchus pacificus TaxID=54126 RepID=A0A2A6C1S4_PRIPA